MKKDAFLINCARGPLIDETALIHALDEEQIAGAGLDVLESNGPPLDHPLIKAWREDSPWLRNRLVITPHTAQYSETALYDMRYLAAETVALFFNQRELRNRII